MGLSESHSMNIRCWGGILYRHFNDIWLSFRYTSPTNIHWINVPEFFLLVNVEFKKESRKRGRWKKFPCPKRTILVCSTLHNPLGQLSLKIHYIEFDITVPLCKMYIENLTSKITMRPYNSVQMSIRCIFSMYCSPKIT